MGERPSGMQIGAVEHILLYTRSSNPNSAFRTQCALSLNFLEKARPCLIFFCNLPTVSYRPSLIKDNECTSIERHVQFKEQDMCQFQECLKKLFPPFDPWRKTFRNCSSTLIWIIKSIIHSYRATARWLWFSDNSWCCWIWSTRH